MPAKKKIEAPVADAAVTAKSVHVTRGKGKAKVPVPDDDFVDEENESKVVKKKLQKKKGKRGAVRYTF